MALQHLRSSTASKRPTPAAMSDGQLAINTNTASPGLFFKDSAGALIKVGPVHVGTTAPNASPAAGGETGNTVGEQWLDTTGGTYVFKVWDGSAWRSETGTFVDVNGDTMTGALILPSGTAAAPALGVGSTDNGIYSPGADQVAISTNGVGRLFIDASGNVGVGDTPSVRLDVRQNQAAYSYFDFYNVTTGGGIVWRQIVRNIADTGTSSIDFVKYLSGGFGIANNDTNAANFTAFNVGASERMRLDSSGRLGVGTSSPYSRLTVIPATDPTTVATANQITIGEYTANSNYRLQLGYYQAAQYRGSIQSYDNGNPYDLILNGAGGNVGIGTTSPVSPLTVNQSNSSIGGGLTINSDTAGYPPSLRFRDNVPDTSNLGTLAADRGFKFILGGSTEAARIDSSGRLLVGTSTARALGTTYTPNFQVEGTTNSSASTSLILNSNNPAGPNIFLGKSRGAAIGSSTLVQNDDGLGGIVFNGADGTDIQSIGAVIAAYVDGTPGANDMPGRLVFSTTADGASSPTEQLRITSDRYVRLASGSGGIQFNGDTAAANALDDYEEGTWTATISGITVGNLYSTYTKIGNTVMVRAQLNVGGNPGDTFSIDGLPFTSGSDSRSAVAITVQDSSAGYSAISGPTASMGSSVTIISVDLHGSITLANNDRINIFANYKV